MEANSYPKISGLCRTRQNSSDPRLNAVSGTSAPQASCPVHFPCYACRVASVDGVSLP
ncbi:uncharacterized protein STEHIDRAFT_147887 [Stereum hirsutum FP-91666 SS1]|uniref:uncharacterized protein n=1 Tax=Stereum hirsutum (strain FP-91666) TaxID=721885 RepID=UPI000444A864|nr:uncharacterized protein STEHIDRAFT_147887 [Stereum hirsutum FP-91666 SS1]EIM85507.1 hypothetical protein STEHIDRAFT_147887 [Stereum hirsutum FP-91666 SS1]